MENNITMGVMELLEKFPESQAFAFAFKNTADIHLKLGDAVFTPNDTKFVSKVKVLTLNRFSGSLEVKDLNIPRGKELVAYTNTEYLNLLKALKTNVDKATKGYDIYQNFGLK